MSLSILTVGEAARMSRQLVGFEFQEIMTPVVCAPTLKWPYALALIRSVHRALAVESLCLNRQEARVNTKVSTESINSLFRFTKPCILFYK